jgi:hypothetical protein
MLREEKQVRRGWKHRFVQGSSSSSFAMCNCRRGGSQFSPTDEVSSRLRAAMLAASSSNTLSTVPASRVRSPLEHAPEPVLEARVSSSRERASAMPYGARRMAKDMDHATAWEHRYGRERRWTERSHLSSEERGRELVIS